MTITETAERKTRARALAFYFFAVMIPGAVIKLDHAHATLGKAPGEQAV